MPGIRGQTDSGSSLQAGKEARISPKVSTESGHPPQHNNGSMEAVG